MERHLHVEILIVSSDETEDEQVLDLVKRFGDALRRRERRSLCVVSAHETNACTPDPAPDPATVN